MKKIRFLLILLLGLTSCQAQNKQKDTQEVTPKGKWQVHREYDENGNLVKYDSVYVWSSSNFKHFPKDQNLDSLLQSYKTFISKSDYHNFQPDFSLFENTDSLFNKNFFDDTFFLDNWNEINGRQMQKMMRRMDSLRTLFLENSFPELIIQEEKK
jgi:hypothetical protein